MLYLPEGVMYHNDKFGAFKNPTILKECMASQKILESKAILCDSEHNLIVNLGYMKGIIPRCEGALGIAEGTTRDIAIISRVNKPVCFIITGFSEDKDGNPIALLSRKRAQQMCMDYYINKLKPGDVIRGVATHLEPFGCFVDIGCGIASLIPIDAISISRIAHPKDRFKTGQELFAVVKSIEPDGRICLSHKELLGTWEENAMHFSAGETVGGIIRSVENYGIFVELTPNLAGLAEFKEDVFVGQSASIYIKSVIPEKMKIKLIVVDAFDSDHSPCEMNYFIDSGTMSHWQYSPACCDKLMESNFE